MEGATHLDRPTRHARNLALELDLAVRTHDGRRHAPLIAVRVASAKRTVTRFARWPAKARVLLLALGIMVLAPAAAIRILL